MKTIDVEVPLELLAAAKIEQENVKTEMAIALYRQGRISLEQARLFTQNSPNADELFLDPIEKIDMSEFISWAAHDLKSPLNAVIGFSKIMLKGMDGPLTDLLAADLGTVYQGGQRTLILINNLIDMARLNNGEIRLDLSANNLAQTILDAASKWNSQNPTKSLDKLVNLQIEIYKYDQNRISQIVNYLLTYASFKIADDGRLSLNVAQDNKNILVYIESVGTKPQEDHAVESRMIEFVCNGLVNLHGGILQIGETNSKGISIQVTLPLS